MPDYQQAKIYKIVSLKTDLVYIGSTTKKYLCSRMSCHRANYKRYLEGKTNYTSSFEVIQHGDAKIELLESFPCSSKDELHKREAETIRLFDKCCNNLIPARTRKEHYNENKDMINKKRREYMSREEVRKRKQERDKKYYHKNKALLNENKRKNKIECSICKCVVRRDGLREHERSQKHKKNILL